jgi:5-methylcytosine-specific restriction protein A
MADPQYRGPWKQIRLAILVRDGYACQINRPGCTGRATQVDHIVPINEGGAWWDRTNLRAACAHCNIGRGEGNGNLQRRRHQPIPPSRRW